MDLMLYQLDPAKLPLQRLHQRILIADTVGLGKTLEIGILMSELIWRDKDKRILVVTVKIEYVVPFDRCDRVEDYETAWKFFKDKYGKE